jgi:hypothetical protein
MDDGIGESFERRFVNIGILGNSSGRGNIEWGFGTLFNSKVMRIVRCTMNQQRTSELMRVQANKLVACNSGSAKLF